MREGKPSESPPQRRVPAISARGFAKTFSGRTVLRSVDLDVLPGEIHGLLGQNGSGKSTLIKILAAYHEPDKGASLSVGGEDVPLPMNPGMPRTLGMTFVHQDLGLSESMTVLENLRIGRHQTRFGWRIPWREERKSVRTALDRFGSTVHPDAMVSSLREVDRAMVAVIRAFEDLKNVEGGLLVLDEPTPYLPRDGVDQLFDSIRDVASRGVGVLFVTHRLEEVKAITDRVTVLRDGELVATEETSSLSESDLIDLILGFPISDLYPAPPTATAEESFSASNVSGDGLAEFSIRAYRGEVIGLTGLLGMGWDRVPYLLFGAGKPVGGVISIGGRTYELREFSPSKAIQEGLALIPANRLRDGGAPAATVAENVTLPTVGSYFSHGMLRRRAEARRVQRLLEEFDVRPPQPTRMLATLSGGNQQKALVAKWFETHPKVFLLHEPAQGVDVGARAQVFARIRDAADEGAVILIASAEYEDLARLCDRVIVFRNGRPVAELHGAALTEERLVEQSFRDERTPGAEFAARRHGTKDPAHESGQLDKRSHDRK